jgi:secondary thiamine-phosphate synthase enzyme
VPPRIHTTRIDTVVTTTLTVDTSGEGFFEITLAAAQFLDHVKAGDGVLLLFIRHTSASLVIQENADPDVRADLVTALSRLAPADAPGCMRSKAATTCRRMSKPCSTACRCMCR